MSFSQLHDGRGIFRRCHASFLFKLSGKVVDGCITKYVSNLGKIHLSGADQLFGVIDLHANETFHNTAVGFFTEQLFQLRFPDQIVFADLFHSQLGVDMVFQISKDGLVKLIGVRDLIAGVSRF